MLSTWLSNTSLKRLNSENVDIDSTDLCKIYDIFLISTVERGENCLINKAFLGLSQNFDKIRYIDLGSLKTSATDDLQALNAYVTAAKKVLIVLDPTAKPDYVKNAIIVSAKPNPTIFSRKDLRCLSYQRHYLGNLDGIDVGIHKSLGEINKNIAIAEPLLRSCQSLYFELSSIKSTEFSDFGNNFNPVGLSILQSCQIARYSGFSKSLQNITITDFRMDSIAECHTIALWIWYYLEGKSLDTLTNTNLSEDTTSYIVNSNTLDTELQFIKENRSERWWLVNPSNLEDKIPCMYEDYLAVINEDSEDKILELLKSSENTLESH